MNRAAALTYLTNEFSEQIADTGMVATDTPGGYGQVIDSALRECGFSRSQWATANVPEDDEARFEVFLSYYALKRFSKLLAQNINVGVSGKNVSLQQAFANVKSLLDAATAEARLYGFNGGVGWVYLNLDIYEPEPSVG